MVPEVRLEPAHARARGVGIRGRYRRDAGRRAAPYRVPLIAGGALAAAAVVGVVLAIVLTGGHTADSRTITVVRATTPLADHGGETGNTPGSAGSTGTTGSAATSTGNTGGSANNTGNTWGHDREHRGPGWRGSSRGGQELLEQYF